MAALSDVIELGDGKSLAFTSYEYNPEHPDVPAEPRMGIEIRHWGCCGVRLLLESPTAKLLAPERYRYRILKAEPLSIEGSIVCECGEIGYINRARWVKG